MDGETPVMGLVEQQEWLKPLGERSDAMVNRTLDAAGDASGAAKDTLINSRPLGHRRHPTNPREL